MYYGFKAEVLARLDIIIANQVSLLKQGVLIVSTLQDDIAAIAAQTTAVDSLTVFVKGLQDKIAAIPGITPEMQAQIDAVFTSVTANTQKITDAMAVNVVTPAV
jgi:septum formation topological specificity factor MinE